MKGAAHGWIPLAAALIALGCHRAAPPEEPNIVVITLDTTRADHLGTYGYFRDTTPHLDAFARRALVFERAYAPMATTLPSHTSLFTGTEPIEHGVLANLAHGGRRFVPSPALRSLARVARDAGWRTAAFVSAAPLKRGSGIEAGFETFDEPEEPATHRMSWATTDAALAWLAQHPRGPLLLWVHYYDAHWPFPVRDVADRGRYHTDAALEAWMAQRRVAEGSVREGVGPEDARATLNAYDAALHAQDAEVGRLLDALAARGDADRTAVVIAGDHGEGLSQHGEAAHGSTWQEQLHVPLFLRVPGVAPRRIDTPISLVDVLPTLLGQLRVPAFAELLAQASGRDALAAGVEDAQIWSQDTGRLRDVPGYRWALTTPHWKYFRILGEGGASREELYDLDADPFELRDVAALHRDVAEQLRDALVRELAAQEKRAVALRGSAETGSVPADPKLVEQLRELGYVEGPAESGEAAPSRPAPGADSP